MAHRRSWPRNTTGLANNSAVIVLEDLQTKAMTGSAKGTTETPGKKVRQKAGLNRSILDQGWGLLEAMLSYKLAWRDGQLIKVPAPYTSQRCSACGHIDAASRKDKIFICTACGHAEDADINAAKNILAAGLAVLSGNTHARHVLVEDAALSGRPLKREPPIAEGGVSCAV